MTNPVRAADSPFAVTVEAGKNYFWCEPKAAFLRWQPQGFRIQPP